MQAPQWCSLIKEVPERGRDGAVGEVTTARNAGKAADNRGRHGAAEEIAGIASRVWECAAQDGCGERACGCSQCAGAALTALRDGRCASDESMPGDIEEVGFSSKAKRRMRSDPRAQDGVG